MSILGSLSKLFIFGSTATTDETINIIRTGITEAKKVVSETEKQIAEIAEADKIAVIPTEPKILEEFEKKMNVIVKDLSDFKNIKETNLKVLDEINEMVGILDKNDVFEQYDYLSDIYFRGKDVILKKQIGDIDVAVAKNFKGAQFERIGSFNDPQLYDVKFENLPDDIKKILDNDIFEKGSILPKEIKIQNNKTVTYPFNETEAVVKKLYEESEKYVDDRNGQFKLIASLILQNAKSFKIPLQGNIATKVIVDEIGDSKAFITNQIADYLKKQALSIKVALEGLTEIPESLRKNIQMYDKNINLINEKIVEIAKLDEKLETMVDKAIVNELLEEKNTYIGQIKVATKASLEAIKEWIVEYKIPIATALTGGGGVAVISVIIALIEKGLSKNKVIDEVNKKTGVSKEKLNELYNKAKDDLKKKYKLEYDLEHSKKSKSKSKKR